MIPLVMPVIGGAIGAATGIITASQVSPAMIPSQRVNTYSANFKHPNLIPPVEGVIGLLQRGKISAEEADYLLLLHGIQTHLEAANPQAGAKHMEHAWGELLKLGYTTPPPDTLIDYFARGILKPDQYREMWSRHLCKQQEWKFYVEAFANRMSLGDCIIAANRGLIADFDSKIRKIGFIGRDERAILNSLREQIPPITDLIRFSVKDVFDPAIAGPNKLFVDAPAEVEKWARAQGLHGPTGYNNPATGKEATWAEIYWAAHWNPISPGQAYTMLHRIRADNQAEHGLQPFTPDNVKQWLKIADYPPAIRDYLMAISFRPLTRIDLKRMYGAGVITDRKIIVAGFKDLGYNQLNAERMADFSIATAVTPAATANKSLLRELLRSYRNGIKTSRDARDQYANSVVIYGGNRAKAEAEFDTLSRVVDVRVANDNVERAIKALRADYLEGAITREQAESQLRGMGITPLRIQQYSDSWSIDLTRPRRIASTQKVQAWYCDGLITRPEAERRLTNLGWSDADRFLYLTESDRCIGEKQAKAALQAAKTEEQRAREIDKAMSRQQNEQRRLFGEWKRINTPARLGKWYRDESISSEEATDRLSRQGWPQEDIDRWLAEQTAPKEPSVVEE